VLRKRDSIPNEWYADTRHATQKKRDNYNKVCAGFSISSVLIFAKTVKWSQIGGKKKTTKKLMEYPLSS